MRFSSSLPLVAGWAQNWAQRFGVRPVPEIPHFDWAVLKAPEASGETFCDGKGFIKGSSRTISHEACHVFVGLGKEAEEHGPKFLACEARFGEVR